MKNIIIIFTLLHTVLVFCQTPTFLDVTQSVGIDDIDKITDWFGNGASLADYDNDGDIDFFLTTAFDEPDRLYRNKGDGTFEDIASDVGLASIERSRHALWFDYDGDHLLDLLVLGDCYNTDICPTTIIINLYKQDVDGDFINVTSSSKLVFEDEYPENQEVALAGVAAGDINNDGSLDVLITTWNGKNLLFLNKANGTFSNISLSSELGAETKYHWQPAFYDFNGDGLLDIYCNIDFASNEFWLNKGNNVFEEVAQEYGAASSFNEMGITLGDYDNDGDMDIYATNISWRGRHNILLKNNTVNGKLIDFSEVSMSSGLSYNGWDWGTTFFDANNDGWLDLMATSGWTEYDHPLGQSKLWLNNKNGSFNDVSDASKINDINDILEATTILAFDMDRDGDLDLLQTLKKNLNIKEPAKIYQNQLDIHTGNITNYLVVKPRMIGSNHFAIGTVIKIKVGNINAMRLITAGTSNYGQEPAEAFFGLSDNTSIDELRIEWPDGKTTILNDIDANQVLIVTNENVDDEQIYGCIDSNSCNYDPKANIDDGSCEYLNLSEISGETKSNYFTIETYSYPLKNNESIVWEIEGGKVLSQTVNSITVEWGLEKEGKVLANLKNNVCTDKSISLQVQLDLPNLSSNKSIARIWNEALLEAIRGDFARPTVHARNLFHASIAFYDIWAIYGNSSPYLIGNQIHDFNSVLNNFTPKESKSKSQTRAISYAAYRLLTHRFQNSPSSLESLKRFDLIMDQLGYDKSYNSLDYESGNAAALGNFVAKTIIDYGFTDNSRESTGYDNSFYQPMNPPLDLNGAEKSSTGIVISNQWQPLTFNTFIDQSGNLIPGATPEFLSPEWGSVHPFALSNSDKEKYNREGNDYVVYHTPKTPPNLSSATQTSRDQYKWNFALVSLWSSHLDPSDGVIWDISPKSIGNIDISLFPNTYAEYPNFYNELEGGDISIGHNINPITGKAYETQMVPRADYARVLAEFWADGPESETPPGHWFTILNNVSDHELFTRKFNGTGNILSPLEWDVKAYFVLGGALHDSAVAAWGIKGWHDYIRPISAIRYMCELGQSSDNSLPNYSPIGIELESGYIEVVEPNDLLSGPNNEHVGKIKLLAWRGHDFISNANTDVAGVGWILAENWWPYQRPSFVTPPFAGFVSGHSTFSRAAAEVLTLITGDEFFPGGMGEFVAKKDEFLVFEKGPSVDVKLQWATYRDASDQTSLSRIWGGIHPPADDIPGRIIGEKIGVDAYNFALPYFNTNSTNIKEDIFIFPNPVKDKLYFKNLITQSEIIIYSIDGKVIKKSVLSVDDDGYSLENLSAGMFIIKIYNENQNINKLIIKD